jgi:yapsin 1/2
MGYFYVNLNLLAVSTSSGTSIISTTTALALLDSGTSLTFVPQDVMQAILPVFSSAQYNSNFGYYTVSCSDSSNEGYFTFEFGFAAIKVSLAEFIVPVGDGTCALGFLPSGDATYTLGDTFLRSAYVVYDLVNNQVGLAQSSFNGYASDVVAFPDYGARIPEYFGSGSCSSTTA